MCHAIGPRTSFLQVREMALEFEAQETEAARRAVPAAVQMADPTTPMAEPAVVVSVMPPAAAPCQVEAPASALLLQQDTLYARPPRRRRRRIPAATQLDQPTVVMEPPVTRRRRRRRRRCRGLKQATSSTRTVPLSVSRAAIEEIVVLLQPVVPLAAVQLTPSLRPYSRPVMTVPAVDAKQVPGDSSAATMVDTLLGEIDVVLGDYNQRKMTSQPALPVVTRDVQREAEMEAVLEATERKLAYFKTDAPPPYETLEVTQLVQPVLAPRGMIWV